MKTESTFNKIARKTGRKISFCKCNLCKTQCKTPCLGTPEDIEKIVDAGHGEKIFPTAWAVGMMVGIVDRPIHMFLPELKEDTGYCTFFKDGLCQLHESGLKPTEGKLSHHSLNLDNFKFNKSVGWSVAKEWCNPENFDTIRRIAEKINKTSR